MSVISYPKTIRARASWLAAIAAVVLTTGIVIAVRTQTLLGSAITDSRIITHQLRNHMMIDMAHDGLRGVVYKALVQAELKKPETAVQDDLEDYNKAIEKALMALGTAQLSAELKADVDSSRVLLNAYVSSAKEIAGLAFKKRADAIKLLPQFEERFEVLKKALDEGADHLEHATAQIEQKAETTARTDTIASMCLLLCGLVVSAAVGWYFLGHVLPRIKRLQDVMLAIADGELDQEVDAADREDEIGHMAQAVAVFRDGILAKADLEAKAAAQQAAAAAALKAASDDAIAREKLVTSQVGAALSRIANKDLSHRMSGVLPPAYRQLETDFNHAMGEIEIALATVRTNAMTINGGANEIVTGAASLSVRTGQQASSLQQTAAALDQITTTVKQATESTVAATEVVKKATGAARSSGDVVRQASVAMKDIEKSAQQISHIIGVIDEIAFQTNLLALNAGVEAARAGDQGRGFAVVAAEVRALAQKSAGAAKEIKEIIAASTVQVGQGVTLMADAGHALESIIAEIGKIDVVVANIASGAREESKGLIEVNTSLNQMDRVTQQNAAMVEHSRGACTVLSQQTETLLNVVNQFRISGRTEAARLAA